VGFEFFFRLQSSKKIAISAMTPSATPTPIPALAPVLSPPDGVGVARDVDDVLHDVVEVEIEAEAEIEA
jgi:hypothetical protein